MRQVLLTWIWGSNKYNQCSLKQGIKPKEGQVQRYPYQIDDDFYKKTKKRIEQVYLGYNAVYIIGRVCE